MTDDEVKALILAYNAKAFPAYFAFRTITETVKLGYIWLEHPAGIHATESSTKAYFIIADDQCVGVVVEMGFRHSGNPFEEENLHWYVLEERRKQGHLHKALSQVILPHMFADGRESQRVTTNTPSNASYALRQGFKQLGEHEFEITNDMVASGSKVSGLNSPLDHDQLQELKVRIREAKGIITSVHERLLCHYGKDSLSLDELAKDLEDFYVERMYGDRLS